MAAYYEAPCLVQLHKEVNALWSGRDRTSDGWIGDASHAARPSDHNPDWADGGVVRARDFDKDGLDAGVLLADMISDPRTNYVIFRGVIYQRIYGFRPRAYTGPNAHMGHLHLSIRHGRQWENDRSPWLTSLTTNPGGGSGSGPSSPAPGTLPDPLTPRRSTKMFIMRRGNSGTIVRVEGGLWEPIDEQTRDDLVTYCGYHNAGNLATATFDRVIAGYSQGPAASALWSAGVGSGENRRALSTVLVSADSAARSALAVAEATLSAVQTAPEIELPDSVVEDLAARLTQAQQDLDGSYTVTIERKNQP